MNKKLFLGLILFLSVIFAFESVDAVGDLNITSVGTVSGYPGESKTVTIQINNTKTTDMATVTFTSTDLVGPSSSVITAPAISDLTSVMGNGTITTQTFTINVPYLDHGVYVGNITATYDASNYDVFEYQVTISAVANMTASTSSLTLRGEEDESVSGTFTIYNKGSYNLTNLAISNDIDLSDNDDDNITLTFSGLPSNLQPGGSATITVKANIEDHVDIGTYSGTIYVNDTDKPTASVAISTTIQVQPEICEDGIVGKLDITLEEPDDGDDFTPGETIHIEVRVRNNDDDDMDVVVEAILYNIDEGEEIETVESDSQEIKDDEREDFDFDLEIPLDLDEDDEYILYVKAYEDGDEDDHCDEDSAEIDIEREKHDVALKSLEITPSSTTCGEEVVITVKVLNVGRSDEDDVYIKLFNNFLKLDQKSNKFDLDRYDDKGDSETKTFYFTIPDNADVKGYSIEAIVYYDDEDESDSEFTTLTITSCDGITDTIGIAGEVSITVPDTLISAQEGSSFSIPVKVTNSGTKIASYEVEVVNTADWAELTSSKTVTLGAGQSTTMYIYLQAKDNITSGKRSATVNVKSGTEILATQTVTVDISKKAVDGEGIVASTTAALTGISSKVFWIIGDIILIVIAIFFIRLIFTGGKKKQTGVEEIKI